MRRLLPSLLVTVALVAAGAGSAAAAPPSTDPPTGLRVTGVSASTVGLAWDPVRRASSYQVWRGTPGTPLQVVAEVAGTSHLDTPLLAGRTYVYAVATVTKKSSSDPAPSVTVRTVPAPPATLDAVATAADTVRLDWAAAVGASGYQVWRSTGTGPPMPLETLGGVVTEPGGAVPTLPTTWTDTGLSPTTTYRYTVRSFNESGVSPDSVAATVTTPAPSRVDARVALSADPNPSTAGDVVTFTAEVSDPTGTRVPTGTATLRLDGVLTEQALDSRGTATFTRSLTTGTRTVAVAYSGDASFNQASAGITHVVEPAPAPVGFAPYRAFATGSWPESVVVADVNGDGRDEAVLATRSYASSTNDYSLLVHDFVPGTAGPTVTRVPTGNGYTDSAAAAAADLDGDGTDDVVLGTDAGVKVFSGSPTGLGAPTSVPTNGAVRDVVTADLTGDGLPDVLAAVKGPSGGVALLLANLGDGTFAAAEPLTLPRSSTPVLAVGDVTADGHDDVAALWSDHSVEVLVDFGLLTGQGAGNWDTFAVQQIDTTWSTDSVAIGDVTGDGYGDLLVTVAANSPNSALVLVPRSPAPRFGPPVTIASYDIPEPVVVADVDRDGRDDVVVAHGGWNTVGLYRQNAGGGLAAEQRFAVPYASHYAPRGLAVGDVTGDGRPDVLLADYNNGLVLLAGR